MKFANKSELIKTKTQLVLDRTNMSAI